MVTTRRMALTVAAPVSSVKEEMDGRLRSPSPPLRQAAVPTANAASPADYERLRGERIKENMERLRSFGILDLSLQLKSHLPPGPSPQRRRKREDVACNTGGKKLLHSSAPKRRSSRCFLFFFPLLFLWTNLRFFFLLSDPVRTDYSSVF